MEDNAFQLSEVEGVPVGSMLPGRQHHLGREMYLLPYRKMENEVQVPVFDAILIPLIRKYGVFLA